MPYAATCSRDSAAGLQRSRVIEMMLEKKNSILLRGERVSLSLARAEAISRHEILEWSLVGEQEACDR